MVSEPRIQFPPYPPTDDGSASIDVSDLSASIVSRESRDDELFLPTKGTEVRPQRLAKLPRYLVGVSSKAYFSHIQTIEYVQQLLSLPPTDASFLQAFFIPSFPGVSTTSLLMLQRQAAYCQAKSQGTHSHNSLSTPFNLLLGAQECHFAPAGAHTGSVAASELAELGCSLVELGHAERRKAPLAESDVMVAVKAYMAVTAGLVPLVCIGERDRPSDPDEAMRDIQPQVESVLKVIGDSANVILGYEPVWAIGQEEPAPADYVCKVVNRIRALVNGRTGDVRILYGGSAKPGIWKELKGSLDGLFLGRFAHDIEALRKILAEMQESWNSSQSV